MIRDRCGLEPELIASGGGVFEIRADEELIFSKRQMGRFPEEGEVLDLLAGMLPG